MIQTLKFLSGLFVLVFSIVIIQCSKQKRSTASAIQIKGSDTMVNLVQAWVEEYKNVAPEVNIEVSGGGSGVGIAALERGAIDIATASRNIKKKEAELVVQNTGKEPVEYIVAYDALAIYVHKDNPLEEISIDQLALIYGEESNVLRWSELGVTIPGVKNDKIIRISRQSSSGTYEFFREKVLDNKDFRLGSCDMNGSKEVVELISTTKTAIGYSGMGYATSSIKMLKVFGKKADISYAPTLENTLQQRYPLARSLQMYTLGTPEGQIKALLEWIASDLGQQMVQNNGFVPRMKLSELH